MNTSHDHSRSPSRPRRFYKRAAIACKACHSRKVRCNVAMSGIPCANCAAGGVVCGIAQRKRRINPDQLCVTPDSQQGNSTSPTHGQGHTENEADDFSGQQYPAPFRADEAASNKTGMAPGLVSSSGASRDDVMTDGTPSPYYLGDERGPLALAFNICRDDVYKSARHVLLPMNSSAALTALDLQCLERRGCFSLPSQEMQDALLCAYFHYIHPFAPVIDVADFMYRYMTGQVSIMLLWSMFAAAGSFVDEQPPTAELGTTRLEVKLTSFERAKALYELEYEKETTVLIQSTYLMSYRLGCLNDVKGPWYWIGIAINLAYTAGLHRLPPPESPTSPAAQSRLWIQLWWSVYCREVWLALGYGRPMRILLNEVTTPIPAQVHVASASAAVNVPDELYRKYLPYEMSELVRLWLCLVKISATLGSVLSSFYAAKASSPTRQPMGYMEQEHLAELPVGSHRSELMMMHVHQIRLYHEATMIILHLPHNQSRPHEASAKRQDSLQSPSLKKLRASALRITHLINVLIGEGFTTHVHMLTVIAIIPSMQVHLIDLMSSNQPTRQAGEHNLHLCLLLLDNLRTTHISARATHCLFKTAIEKIKSKSLSCPCPLLTSGSPGSDSAPVSASPSVSGSDHQSITTDDDKQQQHSVLIPAELSYLDILPMMSPDGEFSLYE